MRVGSYYELYFNLGFRGDIIKHIDIELYDNTNFELNNYTFESWIRTNNVRIYDFGKINVNKKIRLSCKDRYVNSFGQQQDIYLEIKIPESKFLDWKKLNISVGRICSPNEVKRKIGLSRCNTVKVI